MSKLCFCTISVPQSRLQNYFTTKYKRFFLISDVETHFAKVSWCPDIQKVYLKFILSGPLEILPHKFFFTLI